MQSDSFINYEQAVELYLSDFYLWLIGPFKSETYYLPREGISDLPDQLRVLTMCFHNTFSTQ